MPMIRAAAVILGLLLVSFGTARAQLPSFLSCIDRTQSWSRPLTGALNAVTYIVSLPKQPAPPATYIRPDPRTLGWLIGTFTPGPPAATAVEILIAVSPTLAQQFQQVTTGDRLFAQDKARSHELLLIDGTYCPLLAEDAPFSITGSPIWSR